MGLDFQGILLRGMIFWDLPHGGMIFWDLSHGGMIFKDSSQGDMIFQGLFTWGHAIGYQPLVGKHCQVGGG